VTGYLLDTNVVSEMFKDRPSKKVTSFIDETPLDQLYVSVVTIAEIRLGVEIAENPDKRAAIAAWLRNNLRTLFENRILPMTEDVLVQWRLMQHRARKRNHTFPEPDLMIAATAAHHGLTVATRDVSDFGGMGVPLLNPWDN
jgi:hypothetical protein